MDIMLFNSIYQDFFPARVIYNPGACYMFSRILPCAKVIQLLQVARLTNDMYKQDGSSMFRRVPNNLINQENIRRTACLNL